MAALLRTHLRMAALAAAALAAQPATAQQQAVTPREIAASAQQSLLIVNALDARGDTVATGTGFVVGANGTFVTNFHVVEPAASLRVEMLDGRKFASVELIGVDAPHDLALLRIPGEHLHALALGRDEAAQVGDRVYVMGNPMGLAGTFSDGLVSGRRPLEGVSMLQISAPISPGSSGGPVMNDQGQVIGVATLMLVGGQNLNMAVPAQYVRPLLASGGTPRAFTATAIGGARADGHGLAALREPSTGEEPRRAPPRERSASAGVPARQVAEQFEQVRGALRSRGFVEAFPLRSGAAAQAGGDGFDYRLQAGVAYVITARCDNGCSDVDVGVFDPRGELVAIDVERDDYPTVTITPRATATYHVSVRMARCAAEPCAYGLAVYHLARQPKGSSGR